MAKTNVWSNERKLAQGGQASKGGGLPDPWQKSTQLSQGGSPKPSGSGQDWWKDLALDAWGEYVPGRFGGGQIDPLSQGGSPGPYGSDWNWMKNMDPSSWGTNVGGQIGPAQYDPRLGGGGGTPGYMSGGYAMPMDATFNYPSQWQQAQDVFSRYAKGTPVSQLPIWKQLQKTTKTSAEDAIKQVAEQMGMGGMRWSTPALRSGQDVSGRLWNEASLEYAKRAAEAEENARLLAMQAGQNLQGLGSAYAQLPLTVGQTVSGMGGGLFGAMQGGQRGLASEWQRTQPEYSPWMQYGMSMAGQQPYYAPQMYQPSWLSQMLGMASQMIPYYMNQGGGGMDQSWLQNLPNLRPSGSDYSLAGY